MQFYTYDINIFYDNWSHSYYEVLNDNSGALRPFTFTTTQSQELYVQVTLYDPRMYSYGCKTSLTTGKIYVYKGSTFIKGI